LRKLNPGESGLGFGGLVWPPRWSIRELEIGKKKKKIGVFDFIHHVLAKLFFPPDFRRLLTDSTPFKWA